MDILQFLGRFHPLILHLPIGVLVLAFLMAWMGRKEKYKMLQPAVGFALQVGMWSAIVAAISGYLLSLEGGYQEEMLGQHQWLGIGTALLSIVLYLMHKNQKEQPQKAFLPLFGGLMLMLGITGHLGGSLTHGSDFLTAPLSGEGKSEPSSIQNLDSAMVFVDFIQPIFKEKCNSCHNPSKLKGELLLTSIEGIRKGGKNGALFQAGDIKASLMCQRMDLPLEEKEHMPPKGKKQLTEDEIALLEWWIEGGGSFDERVVELERPEKIQSILAKYVQPDNSVFALDIAEANSSKIAALQNAGVSIERLIQGQPFLAASLSGKKEVEESLLKQLKGISEQLVQLDLSNTNVDDRLLSYVKNFPHLQKLFLQKTKITADGLKQLKGMKYLKYLNLYETPIDDEVVEPLAKLAALEKLYLWRTNVSPKAIAALENQHPRLIINAGVDKTIFGSGQLNPPLIAAEKDIFKDTLRITFEMNFKNVNLYYTLDGSPPDSTSRKYEGSFLIDETADIQVIAQKKGWGVSEPAHKLFARAKYRAEKVTLNKRANDRYAASGPKTLGDFKKGTTAFTEGNWLGFEKEHFAATFDLGQSQEVSRVTVSALEDTNSWIFLPKGMTVSISNDGRNFRELLSKKYPTSAGPIPPYQKSLTETFTAQKARFVKVAVKSNLVNPSWHPGAGQPCWVFVDEILIE